MAASTRFYYFGPLCASYALLWLQPGCQTRPHSAHGRPHSAEQTEAIRHALVRALKFGMRQSQVRSWLGEPLKVVPVLSPPATEQWIYETRLPPTYRTIAIEIQEVPWVDPISGEFKIIREPLTGQQRIDGVEILTLTFRDGVLHAVDRKLDEQKNCTR